MSSVEDWQPWNEPNSGAWVLSGDITERLILFRDQPGLFPWPRNFVDSQLMPLVDAYVKERLAEQREAISEGLSGLQFQGVNEDHAEGIVRAFNGCLRYVRDFGKEL